MSLPILSLFEFWVPDYPKVKESGGGGDADWRR